MKRYKGWIVYEVSPGFLGGYIQLFKEPSFLQRILGADKADIEPGFTVSEHWGYEEPKYWLEGLYEAARNYIDSGATEALTEGHHTIELE